MVCNFPFIVPDSIKFTYYPKDGDLADYPQGAGRYCPNFLTTSSWEVARLSEGFQNAGEHSITWDASAYPTGLYFCRMQVGTEIFTHKLMLLK